MQSPDGLPLPQRYWAVLTISLGLTMAVLSGASPTSRSDDRPRSAVSPAAIDLGGERLSLAVTISLLPFSSLGDIFGYRRVFMSASPSLPWPRSAAPVARPGELTRARLTGLRRGWCQSVNTRLYAVHVSAKLRSGAAWGIDACRSVSAAPGPTVASGILSRRIGHGCSRSMCRRARSRC